MKAVIALCILFVGAYCAPMLDDQLDNAWNLFKRVHGRQYNSVEEESTRYVMTFFSRKPGNTILVSFTVETSGKLILPKFVNIILKLTMVFILIH
jgi:hypothetical protein